MALAGAVLMMFFGSAADHRAIWISAAIALAVQVGAFVIARSMAERGNGIAGWGLGAAVCVVALITYGFAIRVTGLPQMSALISLATYFTLSELIEGPFLFL